MAVPDHGQVLQGEDGEVWLAGKNIAPENKIRVDECFGSSCLTIGLKIQGSNLSGIQFFLKTNQVSLFSGR